MKILMGVSAGISLYKAFPVIRRLTRRGHQVRVVMTPNAARMVSPLMFHTFSSHPVMVEDFDLKAPLAHIELGAWADIACVLPATANTVAKLAGGMADNLLTSVMLACDKPKILFPAMNVRMFENRATQDNLETLRRRGWSVIEPACGDMACGDTGRGRLPEEDIIMAHLERDPNRPLAGLKLIVTAGGTEEAIDPVRAITNASSGRMGIEIARALFLKGADVVLVYGRVSVAVPSYLSPVKVQTTQEMLSVLETCLPDAQGLYMAAAPADFRVKEPSAEKLKRKGNLTLELIPNPDILETLSKKFSGKRMVGFALETSGGLAAAREKMQRKGLDYIVLNSVTPEFSPLGSNDNQIVLLGRDGTESSTGRISKRAAAEWLIERTLEGLE